MNKKPEYKVGYCRPPIDTRFKSGKSGNPAGRPKGIMDTYRLLDAILNKKVIATVDGVQIKLSKKQMMLLRLANESATGDINSIKVLFPHILKMEEKKAARETMAEQSMTRTDREILDEYFGGHNDTK